MRHFLRGIPFRYYAALVVILALTAIYTSWRLQGSSVEASAGTAGNDYVFVIDAGHGGEDGGASTADGVLESGINLAIAKKLDDLLHLLGQETVMVRTTDEAIYSAGCTTYSEKKVSDLRNRVKLVNETAGAFLISIHQNQFEQEKYSGAQVFYNAVAPAQQVAEQLQNDFAAALDPENHRKAKSAADTVYLMRSVSAPALLVECGFLSNQEEAEKLQQDDYQKQLALVIAQAVTGYLQKETEGNEV